MVTYRVLWNFKNWPFETSVFEAGSQLLPRINTRLEQSVPLESFRAAAAFKRPSIIQKNLKLNLYRMDRECEDRSVSLSVAC